MASLLDETLAGRDAEQVRNDVLTVALQYQLLSSWASFVAVGSSIGCTQAQPLLNKNIVNTAPFNAVTPTLSYPATATNAMLSIVYGISFLLSYVAR